MMQCGSTGDSHQMWSAAGQSQTSACWQQAQMPIQQMQQPMQMMSMANGEQCAQYEMPMCPMQAPTSQSGDSTPTAIDRCMAIIMPQTGFPCDKDLMAAQLKAAADCQYYED